MKRSRFCHLLALTAVVCVQALPLYSGQAEAQRSEAEAAKLHSGTKRLYEFNKARLGDVFRYLGQDADISLRSLPNDSPEADRLITISLNESPFQALETIGKANGLSLVWDSGVWYVRPVDDKDLVARDYEISEKVLASGSKTLQMQRQELIDDVRAILDLQPDNGAKPAANAGSAGGPEVKWKTESNTLHVVGTRLQHMWVTGYLKGRSGQK